MEDERLIWCSDPGCKCASSLDDWNMYDVPVTFCVKAPRASAANAYVRDVLKTRLNLYLNGHAYKDDHAFVDGHAKLCDCSNH